MSAPGYTGPYGNMFGYILGAGAAVGMPAGSLNQNAFILGVAASYLGNTALPRRVVAAYSNLSSLPGSNFPFRLTTSGTTLAPACVGPAPALFPNRNGFNNATMTSPY
jgi:hypothetical protein